MKFMMEFHYGSPKECEANVEASTYGLPHPCESVSGPVIQVGLVSPKMRGVLLIRGGGSWPTPW